MTSASPISTILVPLDAAVDSDRTELFDVAASLAQLHDAALVFLTVVPELYLPTTADPSVVVDAVTARAKAEFDAAVAERWPDQDSTRRLVRYGPVAGTIIDVAEEVGAELIVMHARRPGFSSYALGSVAGRVVNHAKASVYVVREQRLAKPPKPPKQKRTKGKGAKRKRATTAD